MGRAFDAFKQIADVVEDNAGLEGTHVSRDDDETAWSPHSHLSA